MESYEDIHEALVATRQENARLRTDAEHAGLLLSALESLLRLDLDAEPFLSLFDSLHSVLHFDQAVALVHTGAERLECVASRPSLTGDVSWPIGRFFSKVMAGRVSATFHNGGLEEWREIPPDYLSAEHPGLYLPLQVRNERGVLILLRTRTEDGFDRDDIALAEKFSLAASHALAASEDRRIIRDNMTRALAAEEANRAKDMFIATMSHELKTPLNAIIGFAEILADPEPVPDEQRTDYAGDIRTAGHHLLSIVSDLLLYSQIESGRYAVTAEPLPIEREIATVLRLFDREAGERNIVFDCKPTATGHMVMADSQSLRRILINIIGNAVKFSDDGGVVHIRVAAGRDHGGTLVEVTDLGCGMSEELLARIGEPFLQAETSLARKHQGTGLGLAISLGLARELGGSLTIDSAPGSGTSVRLFLPDPADDRSEAESPAYARTG